MTTLKRDKDLLMDMASFYGKLSGLTPLAAKVYVYQLCGFAYSAHSQSTPDKNTARSGAYHSTDQLPQLS